MNQKQQDEWVESNLESLRYRLKKLSPEKRLEFFEWVTKLMPGEWDETVKKHRHNQFMQDMEG